MSRPLHLIVDFSHLLPDGESGGVKPFFFELMRWLGRQQEIPLRITYLTSARSHHEVRELLRPRDRSCCVRHDPARPVSIPFWRLAEKSIAEVPPDVIHRLGGDVLYCPFGSVEMHCPGIPVISFVADLLHRDYPHTLTEEAIRGREATLIEIMRVADRLQCNSRFVIDRMTHHYGYPPERMFSLYNAIHERLQRPQPGSPPARLPRPPFLFYPANTWRHKNHEVLLVAYRYYLARAGEAAWPLVLTAPANDRTAEIHAYIKALDLAGHVVLLDHLGDAEFAATWRQAGILLFPSLHEGFGIPPIEAMSLGIPIISSLECSLREVVGDAALTADPRRPDSWGEAMVRLTTDEALRQDLIARGARRITGFHWDEEAGKLLTALLEVRGKPGRSRYRGMHTDRWIESQFVLALPAGTERQFVEIECLPIPVSRQLRLCRGARSLGMHTLPANRINPIRVSLSPEAQPLVIEVLDASNLNPADARAHGLLIGRVTLHDGAGETILIPSPA